MRTTIFASLVALLLAGALLGGCSADPRLGYSTESLYPTDVRTVAVPIWVRGKEVYRRDIEIRLTEAVIKRLQQDTPYRIADRGEADTELTGELVLVEQQVLSYNPETGQPRQLEVVITVNFQWKDLRTGEVLMQRKGFRMRSDYIPQSPFGETFVDGSEDVLNKLARQVVEQMELD